jgi:hypothetical protein
MDEQPWTAAQYQEHAARAQDALRAFLFPGSELYLVVHPANPLWGQDAHAVRLYAIRVYGTSGAPGSAQLVDITRAAAEATRFRGPFRHMPCSGPMHRRLLGWWADVADGAGTGVYAETLAEELARALYPEDAERRCFPIRVL